MIRLLTPADATHWKSIRLEALKECPLVFSGSYEEEVERSDEEWARKLKHNTVLAYFDNDKPIGVIAYFRMNSEKRLHRCEIFTTFVTKAHRGKGIMDVLIAALAKHAKSEAVEQLHLDVSTNAPQAKACYERGGFTTYGTKPRTLKVGNAYVDTYMMVKYL